MHICHVPVSTLNRHPVRARSAANMARRGSSQIDHGDAVIGPSRRTWIGNDCRSAVGRDRNLHWSVPDSDFINKLCGADIHDGYSVLTVE